jgi:hypothetical protein
LIKFDLIKQVGAKQTAPQQFSLASDLSHSLPVIRNATISSLVELRQKEGEAFQVYRNTISKVMAEVMGSDRTCVVGNFADLVRPEIDQIENTIKKSRKMIKLSVGEDLILGAGFASLGLFSGILPANIGEIIGALGGFHYASGVLRKLNQLRMESPEARDNKLYFLWKAERILQKH